MAKIPGIYVEVRADLAQLKKDVQQAKDIVTNSANGISNAMNGALNSSQAKSGIQGLITNLDQLNRASKVSGDTFKTLGVDLGSLQRITGTTDAQFKKLQQQMLQTSAAKAQEQALNNIARAAGYTEKEIRALGAQMGVSNASINKVVDSQTKLGKSTEFSLTKFKDMIITVGIYTTAFAAVNAVVQGFRNEIVAGFKAVEEFDMSIIKSTALIATFSEKGKAGDIGGAFIEANRYAKELIPTLEMIDAKSIASLTDLQAMSEALISNGVLLNKNNQEQVEGFTSIANALSILTTGQDKHVQIYQEIRGLMDGEIRSSDALGRLLKAQIPDIEKKLKLWQQSGTVLEEIGKLLQGFNSVTGLLEDQWATVGTTMENIHKKILRGMFEPVFKDLIQLAKELNQVFQDAAGNLTPLARGLIKAVEGAYESAKNGAISVAASFHPIAIALKFVEFYAGGVVDKLEDMGRTGIERATEQINELQAKLEVLQTADDPLLGFSVFKDAEGDLQKIEEIKAKISELQTIIRDTNNEMAREAGRASAPSVPKMSPIAGKDAKSLARDHNSLLTSEFENFKAHQERLVEAEKSKEDEIQTLNENAYEIGTRSYDQYINTKIESTKRGLQAELEAKQDELAKAKEIANQISPITDKEGKVKEDATSKAHEDALKRVEVATRAVEIAKHDLWTADIEGQQAAYLGIKQHLDAYKQIEIQYLEMTGQDVAAIQAKLALEDHSIERSKIRADLESKNAEIRLAAQKAINALEKEAIILSNEASLKTQERTAQALLDTAQINGEHQKSREIQIQLLDIEIARAELAGKLPAEIELLRRQRQELEKMARPLSAMVKGWEDVVKASTDANQKIYEFGRDTAQNTYDAFSDILFDGMDTGFKNVADIAEDAWNMIYKAFLRLLADMAAAWAMSEVASFFGFGNGMSFNFGSGSGVSFGGGGNAGASAISGISSYFASDAGAGAAASSSTNLSLGDATPAIVSAAGGAAPSTASTLVTTAGGVIGVAGGAYGMYSGINSLKEGNYVAGTVQTGLGGYSTYQGAVTLGMIEEGTATAAYESASTAISSYFSGGTVAAETGTAIGTAAGEAFAANAAADAAGTYAASATAAEFGTSGAVATGAAAEGSMAGIGGSMAASAGPAAIIAMLAMWAAMDIADQGRNKTRDKLNEARISPTGFGMVGGIGTDGELTRLSEEARDSIYLLNNAFGEIDAVSIDAASGVMVLANNIVGDNGLITGINYGIETFDNASGAWVRSQTSFSDLMDKMEAHIDVTGASVEATAELVATQAGIPTVADELVIAFTELQTGIFGVAGAAMSGAGTFANAVAMMQGAAGAGINWSGGNNIPWEDQSNADVRGSDAWVAAGGGSSSQSNDGYGANWLPDDFGMAAGGTVAPPPGDDVWRGYKYGEVVLPVDTSRLLDQKLKDGSMNTTQAIADLKDVVVGAILASSTKMRKIETTLVRWEKTGLPAARA